MTGRGEDNALGKMVREAEARRAMRQQVRDEARAIRHREIERQQREDEEEDDINSTYRSTSSLVSGPTGRYLSSRRSSNQSVSTVDSVLGEGGSANRIAELRQNLNALDEKYKEAMIANAQLDNEKQTLRYEMYLVKDKLEDLMESHSDTLRLANERKREISYQRLQIEELEHRCTFLSRQIEARDRLISEQGLVLVGGGDVAERPKENGVGPVDDASSTSEPGIINGMAVVSPELARRLEVLPDGTLESRLQFVFAEKDRLADTVSRLTRQLEEEKEKSEQALRDPRRPGSEAQAHYVEMQRESSRIINDQKFKLQQAQQKITAYEGDARKLEEKIIRLEGQVKRYKVIADTCERQEEELKAEKRKQQRDLRDAHNRIEDLKTDNNSLQRKLEKLTRSAGIGSSATLSLAAKTHNLHSNA